MHIIKQTSIILIPLVVLGVSSLTLLSYLSGGFATSRIYSTAAGALDGYDVVSYFDGKPLPGDPSLSASYLGAQWYFASVENQQMFKANPADFVPQYGGYCAYGMSEGYTAYTDPKAWTVVEGKLFLNYSTDVREVWQQDRDDRIQLADRNWPNSQPGQNNEEQENR